MDTKSYLSDPYIWLAAIEAEELWNGPSMLFLQLDLIEAEANEEYERCEKIYKKIEKKLDERGSVPGNET